MPLSTLPLRLALPSQIQLGVNAVEEWFNVAVTYMSMTNYPYETQFLKKLPGYPCTTACEKLKKLMPQSDDLALFDGMRQVAEVYYNYEQLESCNEVYGDNSADSDMSGWNILACGELAMPMGTDGLNDMYNPSTFDYGAYTKYC